MQLSPQHEQHAEQRAAPGTMAWLPVTRSSASCLCPSRKLFKKYLRF